MREPSIFRSIAVSLLRPVIGSNVEIDVVALTYANKYVSQVERIEISIKRGLISLQYIPYWAPPIRNIFSPN